MQIAADESQIHHAQRVEDFVPVFRENLNAVVATSATGLTAEEADSDRFVDEGQGGEALMREAMSLRHRMCQMPKNPYCEICRRARMYKSKTTKLRHDPLESRGHLEPISKFGERLASDFIIVHISSDGTN